MEKAAAQKLLGGMRHLLLFAAMCIVFPAERNLTVFEGHDPMIGDHGTMCVPGQVMKNVLRVAERMLGVGTVLAE